MVEKINEYGKFLQAKEGVTQAMVNLTEAPKTAAQWGETHDEFNKAEVDWFERTNKVTNFNTIGGCFTAIFAILLFFGAGTYCPFLGQIRAPAITVALTLFFFSCLFIFQMHVFGLPDRENYPLSEANDWNFKSIETSEYESIRDMVSGDSIAATYVKQVLSQPRDLNLIELAAIKVRHERLALEAKAAEMENAGVEAKSALRCA